MDGLFTPYRHSNLPTYAGIVYQGLYPGIDLQYETSAAKDHPSGALKSNYVISPGADPSRIHWRYEGASVQVDKEGNLHIAHSAAQANRPGSLSTSKSSQPELVEEAPVSW